MKVMLIKIGIGVFEKCKVCPRNAIPIMEEEENLTRCNPKSENYHFSSILFCLKFFNPIVFTLATLYTPLLLGFLEREEMKGIMLFTSKSCIMPFLLV